MRFFSALALQLSITAAAFPAFAADEAVYCVEEIVTGIAPMGEYFALIGGEDDGSGEPRRYTVVFSDDYKIAQGIGGTKTKYSCFRGFPNKAPDVITCQNSRVASMTFNYSIESNRFIFGQLSPAGWLSLGTDRESDKPRLGDLMAFGKCEAF